MAKTQHFENSCFNKSLVLAASASNCWSWHTTSLIKPWQNQLRHLQVEKCNCAKLVFCKDYKRFFKLEAYNQHSGDHQVMPSHFTGLSWSWLDTAHWAPRLLKMRGFQPIWAGTWLACTSGVSCKYDKCHFVFLARSPSTGIQQPAQVSEHL